MIEIGDILRYRNSQHIGIYVGYNYKGRPTVRWVRLMGDHHAYAPYNTIEELENHWIKDT